MYYNNGNNVDDFLLEFWQVIESLLNYTYVLDKHNRNDWNKPPKKSNYAINYEKNIGNWKIIKNVSIFVLIAFISYNDIIWFITILNMIL